VTRQLRWIRICDQLELLDAPGVIPAVDNQTDALKLAICDDIGDGAYDNQRVAAALVDLLKQLEASSADLLPKPLQSATDSIPHLRAKITCTLWRRQSRRCRTYSTAAADRFSLRRYAAGTAADLKSQR